LRKLKFLPDPFIGILIGTLVLATLFPAEGEMARWLGTLATAAVVFLFFLHGVRLPRENLIAAAIHWRLHCTILTATYLLFPLLVVGLMTAMPQLLPRSLWVGVLFLSALPSTVQSSIAFTSVANGNVGAAVASAAASNLLGIALTPLILGLLVQAQPGGHGVNFSGIWKIVLQLLLPFAIGHALRPWLGAWATRQKAILVYTDRATIVLAVYSAFSAAVLAGIWSQMPVPRLLLLVAICALLLVVMIVATRSAARLFRFSTEDEIPILFCGVQKSLVSGVPMARVLFAGPEMGAAVLPLMIYHQMQLMVCAWLARRYGLRDGAARNVES
jgi:solute carrier family 10 (sodium/bile acid cotransporter), member 7